ncbi:MAG: hypothetical protein JNK37_13990 [Verrucomicrobiales bacterium]|nr:hypothetical protein [Verrucomicrobiales bacterium]
MKSACLLPFALLCSAGISLGQDAEVTDLSWLSPDGRFTFEAFSGEEVDAGKRPAFGIIEVATGRLVSDPKEPLGDAYRPEETILWAPDSLSYALTTRVGTRHLDTYLYRWDGKAFVRVDVEGISQLGDWSDEILYADKKAQGFSDNVGLGQCIQGDLRAERWLDPQRVIFLSDQAYVVGEGDREGTAEGRSRGIVSWNAKAGRYELGRRLPVAEPWAYARESPDPFVVEQTSPNADLPNRRLVTVKNTETGQIQRLEAENSSQTPVTLESHADWPQLELSNEGPAGFQWRRLYRVVDGAYRCVRIDELTDDPRLAPEGAAPVDLAHDEETVRLAYLLRTRQPAPTDPDSYESFQTAFLSPDGRWKLELFYHPQYLQRVEIAAADGGGEPTVIYDFDSGDGGVDTRVFGLWNPDSRSVAVYLDEPPRVGGTRLYRLAGKAWESSPLPKIDYGFLKETLDAGANWYQQYEKALWWQSPRELVLHLDGNFRGGGPDYRALTTLTWNKAGEPVGSVSVEQAFRGEE